MLERLLSGGRKTILSCRIDEIFIVLSLLCYCGELQIYVYTPNDDIFFHRKQHTGGGRREQRSRWRGGWRCPCSARAAPLRPCSARAVALLGSWGAGGMTREGSAPGENRVRMRCGWVEDKV